MRWPLGTAPHQGWVSRGWDPNTASPQGGPTVSSIMAITWGISSCPQPLCVTSRPQPLHPSMVSPAWPFLGVFLAWPAPEISPLCPQPDQAWDVPSCLQHIQPLQCPQHVPSLVILWGVPTTSTAHPSLGCPQPGCSLGCHLMSPTTLHPLGCHLVSPAWPSLGVAPN